MALHHSLLPAPQDAGQHLPPAPVANLTSTDIQRIQGALDQSTSDKTRKSYASAWTSFQSWTRTRGALAMPASTVLVAAYLTHLAEERRVSVASGPVQPAAGHQDPTDNEGLRKVMHGISRSHGKAQRQAKPLTAEALAAVKATAKSRRPVRHDGSRRESAEKAASRGLVDVALLSILRDGLMRRSEAAALTWADVELRENGTALLQVRRSKTDPEGEGVVLYIGKEAGEALRAIRPTEELLDQNAPVFGLSAKQIDQRVQAAAKAAGLGEGFTGHSGRVGMAQDLVKSGVELPALMTAGRWKSAKMPARYTERQAAGRGAVARYYGEQTELPAIPTDRG